MKYKLMISVCLAIFQGQAQNVYDRDPFSYNGQTVRDRKVIPWPYLKESDVSFVKRVVRVIDTREKQNQPMVWPQNNLNVLIYEGIKTNKLTAYRNDSLTSTYDLEEFIRLGTDTEIFDVPDPNDPSFTRPETIVSPFLPDLRIKKYRVVEDWIFDKTRSQYYVRIVSIAPQYEMRLAGVNLGEQDLCVLKYHSKDEKDFRHFAVNYDVFNRQTNSGIITFDDWFEQRFFSSYIVKFSNEHDRYIRQYDEFKDNGVEALLEAERKKLELQQREENLYED